MAKQIKIIFIIILISCKTKNSEDFEIVLGNGIEIPYYNINTGMLYFESNLGINEKLNLNLNPLLKENLIALLSNQDIENIPEDINLRSRIGGPNSNKISFIKNGKLYKEIFFEEHYLGIIAESIELKLKINYINDRIYEQIYNKNEVLEIIEKYNLKNIGSFPPPPNLKQLSKKKGLF